MKSWYSIKNSWCDTTIYDENDSIVAKISIRDEVEDCEGFDEVEEAQEHYEKVMRDNAALISCAKDMRQQLADLVGEFYCECGHPRCGRENTKRDIEAILAKAGGQEDDR